MTARVLRVDLTDRPKALATHKHKQVLLLPPTALPLPFARPEKSYCIRTGGGAGCAGDRTESCVYTSRSVSYSYLALVLALGYLGEWEV